MIDENHALRVQIAHGSAAVDVDAVERATKMGKTIGEVSQRFLTELGTSRAFSRRRSAVTVTVGSLPASGSAFASGAVLCCADAPS